MNPKTGLSIAAVVVSIAGLAAPAIAGNTLEETHAYLEAERTLTEGKSDGIAFAPTRAAGKRTALDRWFASERARTEGQADRVFPGTSATGGIGEAVHSWFESQRARTEG